MQENYDKMIWSIVHKVLMKIPKSAFYEGIEEDLFQEGYLGLLQSKQVFNESYGTSFSTLAYQYAYGFCMDFIKKQILFKQYDVSFDDLSEEVSMEDEYKISVEKIIPEIKKQLKKTNRQLKEQEENILKDRIVKDYTLKKCANNNNCSIKKVNNVISKYESLIRYVITQI